MKINGRNYIHAKEDFLFKCNFNFIVLFFFIKNLNKNV